MHVLRHPRQHAANVHASGPSPCRLTFPAFLRLLALVAGKKGAPLADVASAVAVLQGPAANGATEPEYVRFHDDRSTYTGQCAGALRLELQE